MKQCHSRRRKARKKNKQNKMQERVFNGNLSRQQKNGKLRGKFIHRRGENTEQMEDGKKKQTRLRTYAWVILILLWMSLIFLFSSRPADISTQDSNRVGLAVGNLFVPGFRSWTEERQLEFAQRIDHPVRKTAHATEYAVLGFLFMGCYNSMAKMREQEKRKRSENTVQNMREHIIPAWISGTVYAATDEFHQLFVPGRSGQVSDVMLDSVGVFLGVVLLYAAMWIWQKYRERDRKKAA
ncbi:MAG: VanZ family protein [bacterium]|nr:VanZ family protein [bacterium]